MSQIAFKIRLLRSKEVNNKNGKLSYLRSSSADCSFGSDPLGDAPISPERRLPPGGPDLTGEEAIDLGESNTGSDMEDGKELLAASGVSTEPGVCLKACRGSPVIVK